jgi:hypothetical protein
VLVSGTSVVDQGQSETDKLFGRLIAAYVHAGRHLEDYCAQERRDLTGAATMGIFIDPADLPDSAGGFVQVGLGETEVARRNQLLNRPSLGRSSSFSSSTGEPHVAA